MEFYIFLAFVGLIAGIFAYKLSPNQKKNIKDFGRDFAADLSQTKSIRDNNWHAHAGIGLPIGFIGVLIFGHWFGMFSIYEPWWFHIYVLALVGLVGSAFWEGGQAIKQGHFQNRLASFKTWGDIIITTLAIVTGGAVACALFIWVA